MMQYVDKAILSEINTHIEDSCQVKSKEAMREYLENLRDVSSDKMAVNQRDMDSMVCEWRSHNFFYKFHVFRNRTKDVDLELKQPWWREWFCRLVSFFYFWD